MAQRKGKTQKKTKKIYRIEMSSSSMFFWAFCFFFLLAWIFVLGIFVGRGFLPEGMRVFSELRNKINKIQGIVMEKNSGESEAQKKKDLNPELAFYKGLSEENEGSNKRQVIVVPKKSSSARDDQASSQRLGFKGSFYTVQLAALGDKGKAEGLIKKLELQGYQAYCREAHLRGKTYYRVRSGKFSTREQAVDHARRLAKETGLKGFVWRVE